MLVNNNQRISSAKNNKNSNNSRIKFQDKTHKNHYKIIPKNTKPLARELLVHRTCIVIIALIMLAYKAIIN